MEGGQLKIFYPRHPLLQKHIEYYYFLCTDDDFCSTYYSFPNTIYSFNIHRAASCQINGYDISVKHDPGNNYLCILQGKYNHPIQVKLEGLLDKVTIGFKPLGLNHFINQPFSAVSSQPSQVFNAWDDSPHYLSFLNAFYQSDVYDERLTVLESFLISQYRELIDSHIPRQILHLLTDFEKEYTLAEIGRQLSLADRTLNRIFHKHFAVSPVTFRQIARFRHSLRNKLVSEDDISLTEISYMSNFYDQSYFIKAYRKLAGDHPSAFFNTIDRLADDRLIFKFV